MITLDMSSRKNSITVGASTDESSLAVPGSPAQGLLAVVTSISDSARKGSSVKSSLSAKLEQTLIRSASEEITRPTMYMASSFASLGVLVITSCM